MDTITGLHQVEDRSDPLTAAYRCLSCGSGVIAEAPTERDLAAVKVWLRLHPSSLPRQRAGS